jgi:glycosyltransferase involved in cell wall biosynthesis
MCDHVDLIAAIPDLTTEYVKASILVMASKAEGQPLVAMEAQRAGVPVVAFDCPGGTASVVTHEQDGLLVPLDDVDALGEALRRLMDDDALRTAMGTAAWTNRHRFAPDLIAQQWADLLCDVASRPPRRSS